jgi:uncharacterized protein with PIN domain
MTTFAKKIKKNKQAATDVKSFIISKEEAIKLFSVIEIYRDYGNGASGLVENIKDLEEEIIFSVEEISLDNLINTQNQSDVNQLVIEDDINLGVEIEDNQNGIINTQKVSAPDADYQRCPVCESNLIQFDAKEVDYESFFVYRTHQCRKCNTKWEERYTLTKVIITRSRENIE